MAILIVIYWNHFQHIHFVLNLWKQYFTHSYCIPPYSSFGNNCYKQLFHRCLFRSNGVFTLTYTETDNWESKLMSAPLEFSWSGDSRPKESRIVKNPKLWANKVSFKQKTGSFAFVLILITTDRNMTFYFTIENINRTHLIP